MKRLIALCLVLVLSVALGLTAFAAGPDAEEVSRMSSVIQVCGKVSSWDGDGLFLKNSDENSYLNQVVVHLGDAPVVDAATGLPLDRDAIKFGDMVYAWVSPVMALSMPPQANAIVVVGNVPADMTVPEYYEVTSRPVADIDNKDVMKLGTANGIISLSKTAEISPWMTRQMVSLMDLAPGTQILVWKNADGIAEKVLVFAYAYKSYLCTMESDDGNILAMVNGEFDSEFDVNMPQFSCLKTADNIIMAPVRVVAEAAGYDVKWDRELGAVVSLDSEKVFSVKPGESIIKMLDGDVSISAPCILKDGVTYIPVADLCMWLDVFYQA